VSSAWGTNQHAWGLQTRSPGSEPIGNVSASRSKGNGFGVRTQFSWVPRQNPRIMGPAEDPILLGPVEDPILMGPTSGPNSLGSGVRTQGSKVLGF